MAKGALSGLRRVLDRAGGARLCYGEPIQVGDRTVIPVARVRASGGALWGTRRKGDGGSAGAGSVDAVPMGFIEAGPYGTRFEAIPDPEATTRALRAGTAAAATALTTGVGAVAALRGRRARRLLGR